MRIDVGQSVSSSIIVEVLSKSDDIMLSCYLKAFVLTYQLDVCYMTSNAKAFESSTPQKRSKL